MASRVPRVRTAYDAADEEYLVSIAVHDHDALAADVETNWVKASCASIHVLRIYFQLLFFTRYVRPFSVGITRLVQRGLASLRAWPI
jgi:hypothetical protein